MAFQPDTLAAPAVRTIAPYILRLTIGTSGQNERMLSALKQALRP